MTIETKPNSKQPKVRSGQFGAVYKFTNQRNMLALKVFTKAEPDRDIRYSLIFDQLSKHSPFCFIHFTHDQEGILCPVNGRPYRWPTVIMDWVKGQAIDRYLAGLLNQNGTIENGKLCRKWADLILSLSQSQIAHGDLQQGNILVLPDGSIKLVDYDGLFVPAMLQRKLKAAERGLPSYQHPKRNSGYFDERLDDFSALLILLTFACFDGYLWRTFNPVSDDKYILIHKDDFTNPSQSQLMNLLTNSPDIPVKKLAKILLAAAKGPLEGIPRFAKVLEDKDVKRVLEPSWQPTSLHSQHIKKSPPISALKCVRCKWDVTHTHPFCAHCGELIPGRKAPTPPPLPPTPPARLTLKQQEFLSMFAGGLSEQQMADKLGIAKADVSNQIGIAMAMAGVNSFDALKNWSVRNGIRPYQNPAIIVPPPPPSVDPAKQQQQHSSLGCILAIVIVIVGGWAMDYCKKSRAYTPSYIPPSPPIETPLANQPPPPEETHVRIIPPVTTELPVQSTASSVQRVWIERNYPCGNENCLVVKTDFQINRSDSTQAWIKVYLWRNDGSEMLPQRNDFNIDGQAGMMKSANVEHEVTVWRNEPFPIPISAIENGENHFATVEIDDIATNINLGMLQSETGFNKW